MPGTLRTESHKQKLPKGWTYLLGLMDIANALEPRLTHDAWLSLQFSPRQAYWKEKRDEIDERRRYTILRAQFGPGGEHLPHVGARRPWDEELHPQVVTAEVLGVPHDALPPGIAVRPIARELLAEAFLELTPLGLSPDRSPRRGWLLEVLLDAQVDALEAILMPWNGALHEVSKRVQRQLRAAP